MQELPRQVRFVPAMGLTLRAHCRRCGKQRIRYHNLGKEGTEDAHVSSY